MITYLSLPEAAREIGVPVGTVKMWHAEDVFAPADAVIGQGTGSARRYGWKPETVRAWAHEHLPLDRRAKE